MGEPKIVLLDLETLPNPFEAIKVWPQLSNWRGLTLRATVSTIICAGWKILGGKGVECINAWDFPQWKENVNDDGPLCLKLHKELSDADAIVTHNGKRFDWPFLQTRLLKNKIAVLDNIPHVDTKDLFSRYLFAFSNRLDYLGQQFVDDKKKDHGGWDLWVKVYDRDPIAMKTMTEYCKQDVLLLEKLFNKVRPFANNLPNRNLWLDPSNPKSPREVCPRCGSDKIKKHGWRHTKVRSYKRFICLRCGSFGRYDFQDNCPR